MKQLDRGNLVRGLREQANFRFTQQGELKLSDCDERQEGARQSNRSARLSGVGPVSRTHSRSSGLYRRRIPSSGSASPRHRGGPRGEAWVPWSWNQQPWRPWFRSPRPDSAPDRRLRPAGDGGHFSMRARLGLGGQHRILTELVRGSDRLIAGSMSRRGRTSKISGDFAVKLLQADQVANAIRTRHAATGPNRSNQGAETSRAGPRVEWAWSPAPARVVLWTPGVWCGRSLAP